MKKLMNRLRDVFRYLKPMDISIHSAYTSFFLILSLFPGLLILFGLLAYTSLGLEEVLVFLEGFLPTAFMPLAERMLIGAYEHTSGTIVSVSALVTLWSAGRGVRGLLNGLNAVYGLEENRSYFATRSISMLYTFLFLVVLILTLVMHVFGNTIIDYLRMTTNPLVNFLMDVVDWRFLLLLALQTTLFAGMYAFLPNRRHRLKDSLPGALLAAFGWTVCSALFSIYVTYFPNYANVFGSLYAAALAMLWLYFCIGIIFYGAALNRTLLERKKQK